MQNPFDIYVFFTKIVGDGWGILKDIDAKHAVLVQLELLLFVRLHYANLLLMNLEVLITLLVTLNEANSDLEFGRGEKETNYIQVKEKMLKEAAQLREGHSQTQ